MYSRKDIPAIILLLLSALAMRFTAPLTASYQKVIFGIALALAVVAIGVIESHHRVWNREE